MVYGIADLSAGLVKMVQAGHPHPLLLRHTGEMEFVGEGGAPIGLLPDIEFQQFEIQMTPGGRRRQDSVFNGLKAVEESCGIAIIHDGVRPFVEDNFYKPSELKRTIAQNKETMFYVVLLSHLKQADRGVSRTGLFLDGQDLMYKLTVHSTVSKSVPFGRIALIKE